MCRASLPALSVEFFSQFTIINYICFATSAHYFTTVPYALTSPDYFLLLPCHLSLHVLHRTVHRKKCHLVGPMLSVFWTLHEECYFVFDSQRKHYPLISIAILFFSLSQISAVCRTVKNDVLTMCQQAIQNHFTLIMSRTFCAPISYFFLLTF